MLLFAFGAALRATLQHRHVEHGRVEFDALDRQVAPRERTVDQGTDTSMRAARNNGVAAPGARAYDVAQHQSRSAGAGGIRDVRAR